jgi:hypothetical protein
MAPAASRRKVTTMTKLRLEPEPHTDPTAAQAAVQTFEGLALGQPYASLADAAGAAVGALAAGARTALFPAIVPMTADSVTAFTFHEESFTRSGYASHAANLHQQCLAVMPSLASFLRSGPVCARVAAAAVASAPAVSGTQADVAARAVEGYQRTIAGQLVGIPEFEPAASILAVTGPALQARIETCRARHEAHVKAELDRIEGEKNIAAEVVKAAEVQQREELAAYFAARHGKAFSIRGNILSAQALAAILRHEGGRNFDGDFVTGLTLEELQALRVREEAGDQAVLGGGVQ